MIARNLFLSTIVNLHTNCHINIWIYNGASYRRQVVYPLPKHRKENHLLSLEHSCWLPWDNILLCSNSIANLWLHPHSLCTNLPIVVMIIHNFLLGLVNMTKLRIVNAEGLLDPTWTLYDANALACNWVSICQVVIWMMLYMRFLNGQYINIIIVIIPLDSCTVLLYWRIYLGCLVWTVLGVSVLLLYVSIHCCSQQMNIPCM